MSDDESVDFVATNWAINQDKREPKTGKYEPFLKFFFERYVVVGIRLARKSRWARPVVESSQVVGPVWAIKM